MQQSLKCELTSDSSFPQGVASVLKGRDFKPLDSNTAGPLARNSIASIIYR